MNARRVQQKADERTDRIYSAIVRYGEPLTVEQIRAALALYDLRADVRRWER